MSDEKRPIKLALVQQTPTEDFEASVERGLAAGECRNREQGWQQFSFFFLSVFRSRQNLGDGFEFWFLFRKARF